MSRTIIAVLALTAACGGTIDPTPAITEDASPDVAAQLDASEEPDASPDVTDASDEPDVEIGNWCVGATGSVWCGDPISGGEKYQWYMPATGTWHGCGDKPGCPIGMPCDPYTWTQPDAGVFFGTCQANP